MKKTLTTKLYYGEYPYKVTINTLPNANNKKQIKEMVSEIQSFNYKTLQQYGTFFVYFKDPSLMSIVEKHIPEKHIVEYCYPINQNHVDMLAADEKLITRKTLFEQKYRYAIRFDIVRNRVLADSIKEWYKDNKDLDIYCRENWLTSVIFANSKDDLMCAKLSLQGNMKIERIVLFDEIEK